MAVKNKIDPNDGKAADLEKELDGLIIRSDEIVEEFVGRLKELRQARSRLIDDILKRQDDEKIQAILKMIK